MSENSPSQGFLADKDHEIPEKERPILRWVLMAVTALAAILVILVANLTRTPEPGGLDGCLYRPDGSPLVASVTIGEVERVTADDGCFFFPSLPLGEQEMIVETSGDQWSQTVSIISGQATSLGEMVLQ